MAHEIEREQQTQKERNQQLITNTLSPYTRQTILLSFCVEILPVVPMAFLYKVNDTCQNAQLIALAIIALKNCQSTVVLFFFLSAEMSNLLRMNRINGTYHPIELANAK